MNSLFFHPARHVTKTRAPISGAFIQYGDFKTRGLGKMKNSYAITSDKLQQPPVPKYYVT